MNQIKLLRERLGVTQEAMAAAIGVSQANVSFYEKGQQMPPQVARLLIEYARRLGHFITFDDVYGPLPDPPKRRKTDNRRRTG
jgi:putative transcriptional regulator